jgi:hypothetical protein
VPGVSRVPTWTTTATRSTGSDRILACLPAIAANSTNRTWGPPSGSRTRHQVFALVRQTKP